MGWQEDANKHDREAMAAAEAGDWDRMMTHARRVPSNWDIWQKLPGAREDGLPDEALHRILDYITTYQPDNLPNFLFEASGNLRPDASPKLLERMGKLGMDDQYVTENITGHPNWKPPDSKLAADFWHSYETSVDPAHFATVKSLFSGQPETVTHREETGSSDKYAHVIPHLLTHAKEVQKRLVQERWDEKFKDFNGEPYVKVYRGVGGPYAEQLRGIAGVSGTDAPKRTIKIPALAFHSWSTDIDLARRFAEMRDRDLGTKQGLVIEKYLPLRNLLHAGYLRVAPGQDLGHPSEKELVFGHPEGHVLVPTSGLHLLHWNERKPQTLPNGLHLMHDQASLLTPETTLHKPRIIPKPPKGIESPMIKMEGFPLQDEPMEKVVLDPNLGITFQHHTSTIRSQEWDQKTQSYLPYTTTNIQAIGPDGKGVGRARLAHSWEDNSLVPQDVVVDEAHRRKGIASAMYAHAEKVTGKRVQPSDYQTPEGRAFWEGNWRNPQFGVDPIVKKDLDPNAGYVISHDPDPDGRHITVYTHLNDQKVGELDAGYSESEPGRLYPGMVKVHSDHRRKGIATAMYQYAEKVLGQPFTRGHYQSPEAQKLWGQKNRPFGKSIKDLPVGKVLAQNPENGNALFDYTHLLKPHLQQAGYSMVLRVQPKVKSFTVEVHSPDKETMGITHGNWVNHKGSIGVKPHSTFVEPNLRKKHLGLGQAMYEAFMTHGLNFLQATHVFGDNHSTSAAFMHAKLARKHGLAYKMIPNVGGEEYPDKMDWMESPVTDWDGKYRAYNYLIKKELQKGSMARLAPAPPKPSEDYLNQWEDWCTGVMDEARQILPPLEGPLRMRALHKLHASTPTRRNPQTREREFLLHRGVGPEELANIQNNKYLTNRSTSWTPDPQIARTFGLNYSGWQGTGSIFSGGATPGGIISAWVPESALKSYSKVLEHQNQEKEVVVHPSIPFEVVQVRNPREAWEPPRIAKSEMDTNPQAVSIIVENNHGHILWGQRQKDGSWTMPGGHMDDGETPLQAALRELYEEAGLVPDFIQPLSSYNTPHGVPVHVFRAVSHGIPRTDLDPDCEVSKWTWQDCFMGVPQEILGNLAHKKNVALEALGLQNPMVTKDLAKTEDEDVAHEYISGLCGEYAIAHHEATGHPIYAIKGYYDDTTNTLPGEPPEEVPEICHFVTSPDGGVTCHDATGSHSADDLIRRARFGNKVKRVALEPMTRQQIEDEWSIHEGELNRARQFVARTLGCKTRPKVL